MDISVGDKNLENLFSGKQHLVVPGFQRSYAWTLDQVNEYWTDLKNAALTGEGHFWGPIVLLKDSKDDGELKLIDGQQRITTSMITLALLRDAAFSLENRVVREGTPGQQDVFTPIRNFLFRPTMYTEPRFKASYLIDDVFRSHILADPQTQSQSPRPELTVRGKGLAQSQKNATGELRKAYLRLKELMKTFLEAVPEEDAKRAERILDLFTALTSGFEIHTMVLTSEDDAYILFETLNDRGLQLNPSDLLKTLTLREIRQSKSPEELAVALNTWDRMVQNLGDYDFSKFLRHYLLTQSENPVQAKKIFTYFKDLIEKQGKDGAERNLQKLVKASESYSKLLGISDLEDEELKIQVQRLNTFSDTHRVFLLAAMDSGLDDKTLKSLFRATEYLASRWIVNGENAQELEGHYQKQARALLKAPNAQTAKQVLDYFFSIAPSDAALSMLFTSDKVDMQRYFLRRIESASGGEILSWDKAITIEHLAPQTPDSDNYWPSKIHKLEDEGDDDFTYEETIKQWGNLTLLEKKLNSSIQNSAWPRKVAGDELTKYDGLSSSTMNLNKVLVALPEWNRKTLSIRNDWIMKASLALVSKSWVTSGEERIEKLNFSS